MVCVACQGLACDLPHVVTLEQAILALAPVGLGCVWRPAPCVNCCPACHAGRIAQHCVFHIALTLLVQALLRVARGAMPMCRRRLMVVFIATARRG